jgi:hypothetical protein
LSQRVHRARNRTGVLAADIEAGGPADGQYQVGRMPTE